MHGYELRKRLTAQLGAFRALSYGSLYPCLKDLLRRGWIAESTDPTESGPRRSKIVYQLTADGKEHFQNLLAAASPADWDDETFGVRMAFFGRTDADTRMRILIGRRGRLEERLETLRGSFSRTRERLDDYTLALQNHGLESVEREVRWLNELIDDERKSTRTTATTTSTTSTDSTPSSSREIARGNTEKE
jgi:DNA-binding PadR family transcriptional regulator